MKTDYIPTVKPFDLKRYLGKWYEIARLPNRFEENLEQVTADYSLKEDGEIKVLNRGFNTSDQKWEEAEGRAWVPDTTNPSDLKVSFFWIFSSGYKVIALDQENYSYSMVTSSSKKYLWILSRTKDIDLIIYDSLIRKADSLGFNIPAIEKINQM
jgi:apolipoprotein D and lipocalin family protein